MHRAAAPPRHAPRRRTAPLPPRCWRAVAVQVGRQGGRRFQGRAVAGGEGGQGGGAAGAHLPCDGGG
eukprot:3330495-Prymnesium_polylepis.1